MKKYHVLLCIFTCFITSAFSQNSDLPFSYDVSKAGIGTVNFYKVYNMDKEQFYEIAIYHQDEVTFHSVCDLSNIFPQIQISTEKYNKDYFCFEESSNYNPFAYARIKNTNDKVSLRIDLKNKKAKGELSVINMFKKNVSYSGDLDLLQIPSYEISGGQTDLWYSMRFVKPDSKEFLLGTYTIIKAFEEKMKYLGTETVYGKSYEKWEAIILDKNGNPTAEKQIFWFDTSNEDFVLIKSEMHIKGSVFQNSLIELTDSKIFTEEQWNDFVLAKTEAVRVKLNIPEKE